MPNHTNNSVLVAQAFENDTPLLDDECFQPCPTFAQWKFLSLLADDKAKQQVRTVTTVQIDSG